MATPRIYPGWCVGLVRSCISAGRSVDRTLSYKAVRAARGKILRAEPIAALYEQGRIHHCGTFAALEDQLCMYTHESRDSPDRLDALVWALTDLMIGKNDGGMSRVRGL
mgnify:CR=1 FL=1